MTVLMDPVYRGDMIALSCFEVRAQAVIFQCDSAPLAGSDIT